MAEDIPPHGVHDKDFVAPPTTESLRAENEMLRKALETHDYATFSMWLQKNERELQDNPVEHAQLLARAATILDAVGNDDGATKLLLRAAPLVRGKDPKTESRLLELLQLFGGDEAVNEYSGSLKQEAQSQLRVELDDVQSQYSEITDQLVQLDAHDWRDRGFLYTEQEREVKLKELREELQQLIERRAELRHQLDLDKVKK